MVCMPIFYVCICIAYIRLSIFDCAVWFSILQGEDCYANGADIAITKDNMTRKERHPTGSMWDHVVADILAQLTAPPPRNDRVEEVD